MTGGLIVSHGDYGRGLLHALEMIAGKQEKMAAVSLAEGEGLPDLLEKIRQEIGKMDINDIFLFVDMFGATPCNAASLLCSECGFPVIAGANLPVLLTFVLNRETEEKEVLLEQLSNAAKEGFRIVVKEDLI